MIDHLAHSKIGWQNNKKQRRAKPSGAASIGGGARGVIAKLSLTDCSHCCLGLFGDPSLGGGGGGGSGGRSGGKKEGGPGGGRGEGGGGRERRGVGECAGRGGHDLATLLSLFCLRLEVWMAGGGGGEGVGVGGIVTGTDD